MTNDNLGKIAKYLDEWKPIGVKEILGRDNALLLFDEVCQLSNLVEAMKKENAELKAAIDEDKYIFTQHGKTLAGLDKKDEENDDVFKPHWECPQCGPHVKADEDGCCSMCGATCRRVSKRGDEMGGEPEPEKKRQWAEGLFLTINPEIKVKLKAAQKALAKITAKIERGEIGGDDEKAD